VIGCHAFALLKYIAGLGPRFTTCSWKSSGTLRLVTSMSITSGAPFWARIAAGVLKDIRRRDAI
jgi:hypothetical protein